MTKNTSKLTRRDFLKLSKGLAAGVLLTACGLNNGEESLTSTTGTNTPSGNKVQLSMWSHEYGPWNDELTRQKEAYEAANPNVEITYTIWPGAELATKLITALEAGTGPDIIGAHSSMTPNLIAGGHVVEAPDWAVADIKERFFPVCIDGATFRGKTYGYNQHIGGRQMIANTGLLKEFGLELPESWDDMLALMDAIDKNEGGAMTQAVANFGYTGENLFASWGSILMSYGGQILTDDLKKAAFNSAEGLEATKVWTNFVHPEMGNTFEVFTLGQTAIFEAGPAIKPWIEATAPEMEFEPCKILAGPQNKIQCDYVWNWLVNSASTQGAQEASFEFTRWLNSVDNQVAMYLASSLIPTNEEALNHPSIANETWAKTYVEQLTDKYQYVAKISNWQEVEKAISDEFSLLATGAQSAEETLAVAEEAVNKLLEVSEFYG